MREIRVYSEAIEKLLDEVKPYWNNPRLNEKTKQALVDAYQKIGFNQPILIDAEGIIVKGHARYYAARLSGMETIPCIISQATDRENKEDRILDNSIQDLSAWDPDRFEEELKAVDFTIVHVFEDLDKEVKSSVEDDPKVYVVCPKCGREDGYHRSDLMKMETVE